MSQKTFSNAFLWMKMYIITVTSKWASWRLKSPASQVFTQSFVQAHIRIHESSASLAFVKGIHRWLVDSLQKGSVTRKMFSFNGVIVYLKSFSRKIRTHLFYIVNSMFDDYLATTGARLLSQFPVILNLLFYLFIYLFYWGGGGGGGGESIIATRTLLTPHK